MSEYPTDMFTPCTHCATTWVDNALRATDVTVADLERRRLIASLLSRPHLIVSGPGKMGKRRLAHDLALSMVNGRTERILTIQGHPWWASSTGDVANFVGMQTEFSTLRLNAFLKSILETECTSSKAGKAGGEYVVCVEQISQAEMNLYFERFAWRLCEHSSRQAHPISLRLIGTLDRSVAVQIDDRMARLTSLVHLDGMSVPNRMGQIAWN